MAKITIKQLAKKHGVSYQRIQQLLKRKEYKDQCEPVSAIKGNRPVVWLVPEDILDGYMTNKEKQSAGYIQKKTHSE